MKRTHPTLPTPTVCHWMDGTFNLPNADGKMEPWAGRVFIAVCAGGIQDPESCYCADYIASVRITIGNLRAEIHALRGEAEAAAWARADLSVAKRRIEHLARKVSAAERALSDAGLPVPWAARMRP